MAIKRSIQSVVYVSKKYNNDQLMAIGADIVKYVRERTKNGRDINEQSFKAYSKDYKESLNFKIAGKSKNKVDLTLSGDMLASLRVVDMSKGKIVIGYAPGDDEAGKAEGNNIGTYGRLSGPRQPRPFIGIDPKILEKNILSKYPTKDMETTQARAEMVLAKKYAASALVDFGIEED